MYWFVRRCAWILQETGSVPNLSPYIGRPELLELTIRVADTLFEPIADRIESVGGWGTMSNPENVSSGSRSSGSRARLEAWKEASVGNSGASLEVLEPKVGSEAHSGVGADREQIEAGSPSEGEIGEG